MTASPDTLAALESAVRPVLLGARDTYFNLLTYSAIAVGVGVVLEGVELAKDWRGESQWLQRIRLPVPHAGRWILAAASFGWLLVALGVFGEFWFEDRVSWYDHTIRAIDDNAEILLAGHTSDTQLVTAELNKRAEDEATARATLEKEAARLREQAQGESLARLKLQAVVSPREFTDADQPAIIDALRKFRGHPAVIVKSYGLDGEAAALGEQIISVIYSATGVMPVDQRATFISTGAFDTGIQIRGPESDGAFMGALETAFTSNGKLKEVHVNGPTFTLGSMIGGPGSFIGNAVMGGPRGTSVTPPIPTTGQVTIMVGIKPLPQVQALTQTISDVTAQLTKQAPRWQLLEANEDSFVADLKSFSGQRVRLLMCGRSSTNEAHMLWGDMFNMLRPGAYGRTTSGAVKLGAGWDVDGASGYWEQCDEHHLSAGIMVFVNSTASTNTINAAKALSLALKAIPIPGSAYTELVYPQFAAMLAASSALGSPEVLAESDNREIFVLIQVNPLAN